MTFKCGLDFPFPGGEFRQSRNTDKRNTTEKVLCERPASIYIDTQFVFFAPKSDRHELSREPTPVQDHSLCLSVCTAPMFNTKYCHHMSNSAILCTESSPTTNHSIVLLRQYPAVCLLVSEARGVGMLASRTERSRVKKSTMLTLPQ